MAKKTSTHPTDAEVARQLAYADVVGKFPYMFRKVRGREDFFRYNPAFGDGWMQIFKRLCERIDQTLPPAAKSKFRLTRAKEKYGGLRVYFQFGGQKPLLWLDFKMPGSAVTARPKARDDVQRRVLDLIVEAQVEAARTCEICGKQPATLVVVNAYLQTLCDEHFRVLDESTGQP